MLTESYPLEYISELELESIYNFAIQECLEIVFDETEFFFQSKEHLIDIFIEGIDFSKLTSQYLQERFSRILYSKKEIEYFIAKIEKRIQRELTRISIQIDFNIESKTIIDLLSIEENFYFIFEAARTYALCCTTSKAINTAWKKGSKNFMPKVLVKLGMKFNAGDYFLSNVGLAPKELKCNINKKILKSIRGILKNNKHELTNFLKSEIIKQIINSESLSHAIILERNITKTA